MAEHQFYLNAGAKAYFKTKDSAENSESKGVAAVPIGVEVYFDHDRQLKNIYTNDDGTMTASGHKAVTTTLVQGLIASIHAAHEDKTIDSAEHLRTIIEMLEDGFVSQGKTFPNRGFEETKNEV